MVKSVKTAKQIIDKCKIVGDCLIWTGHINGDHLPVVHWYAPGMTTSCRRIVFEERCGPIPSGYVVVSLCGDRLCLNPKHLTVATQAEVSRKALEKSSAVRNLKNRERVRKNGGSKITIDIAREIRNTPSTHREMAEKFGISTTQVSNIRLGKVWRDNGVFSGLMR